MSTSMPSDGANASYIPKLHLKETNRKSNKLHFLSIKHFFSPWDASIDGMGVLGLTKLKSMRLIFLLRI